MANKECGRLTCSKKGREGIIKKDGGGGGDDNNGPYQAMGRASMREKDYGSRRVLKRPYLEQGHEPFCS